MISISRRFLSNSSSHFAKASLRHLPFLVSHQIRHLSAKPRFDFGGIREPKDATALFQEMLRMRPLPPLVDFTQLFGVLVDMKQYSLALQMLDEMLWRDASIKRSTFNIVMSLFHRMVRMRPPPSVFDYTKFWSGVIKIKQYSVALHLFHQMLRMDAPVDGYTLSIAINCFCCVKRPDFGFAVLGSFFKRGYEPDVVTFTTLLKGLMLVGKIQEAAKLLAEQVCYPNEVNYHTIINGLCKAGHTLDALDLLGSFEKGSCKPNELCEWSSTLKADRPLEVDHHLHEFGSVHYHVRHSASDPLYTYLSVSTPLLSQGLPVSSQLPQHTLETVKRICPEVMEAVDPPNEGYQLTLKLSISKIPQGKASTKMISDISSVQAVLLSSQLKEILKNDDFHEIGHGICKPIKLIYHPREPFFIIKHPAKVTAIFPMRFKEKEDVIIATAFFQELMDVGSSKALKKAPHCIWSPIPPPELRGEQIEDLSTNGGFLSFDITSRHVKGKKLEKTVWNLLNFYTFVKYHVKSTRGFIQRRMRTRLDKLVQPLHDVEIHEETNQQIERKRRHTTGCTNVGKWIRASKTKILKGKHDFTSKMKRIRSRIKIHGFSRFRRKWLSMPKFSPVTRYMRLK